MSHNGSSTVALGGVLFEAGCMLDREIVLSASVVVRTGDVTGGRFRESREYRQFRRTEVFSIHICGAIVLCT